MSFRVDYPDHPLNRVTTLLWPVVAIPIAIVLASVAAVGLPVGQGENGEVVAAAGGLLVMAPALIPAVPAGGPSAVAAWVAPTAAAGAPVRDEGGTREEVLLR